MKAFSQAEKAAAVVSAYEAEAALMETAENLVKVSRLLLATMKEAEKDEN